MNVADMVRKNRHQTCCRLTPDDVLQIRAMYRPGIIKQQELADLFGVAQTTICYAIRYGWKHVP